MAPGDTLDLVVRIIHIVAGVIWVGGIVYAGMIVGRRLSAAPPQVRGPAMGAIGPTGYRFLVWSGVVTIVFGLWNGYLMGGSDFGNQGDAWRNLMTVGLLFAVAMLGVAGAVVGPSLKKLAAQPPPEQAAAIQKRLMMAGVAGVVLGLGAVIVMVWATFVRSWPAV